MYLSAQCTPVRLSLLACIPAYLASYVSTYLPMCTAFVDLPYLSIWFYFFSVPLPGSSGLFWHPRMLWNLEVLTLLTSEVWRPSLLFGCGCQWVKTLLRQIVNQSVKTVGCGLVQVLGHDCLMPRVRGSAMLRRSDALSSVLGTRGGGPEGGAFSRQKELSGTEKRRKRLERATLGQHGKNTIYVSQQGRMTTSHAHEVLPKNSMYLSGVAVPKFGIQRPSCTTFGACHLVFKCFPVIVNQTGGARYCN